MQLRAGRQAASRQYVSSFVTLTGRLTEAAGPTVQDGLASKRVPELARRPAPVQHPPKPIEQAQREDKARHLLRGLLRECTYIPDTFAATWAQQYILKRFRDDGFKAWEHRTDPAYGRRLQHFLRNARVGLGLLQRATDGERKALLRVLLMAYGRIGVRRHELMKPLKPIAPSEEPEQATMAELRSKRPGAEEVNEGEWEPYAPAFTPQMLALLRSQIQNPPPHLTRPVLRRLRPQVELLNSWMRPMPRVRVKNKVKAWYASVLDRTHPPLPLQEWERLFALATGQQREEIKPRRSMATSAGRSALELVLMHGKPSTRQTFGNRDAHNIRPRYMQRIWAQVFAQCPTMTWDAEKGAWAVRWGHQALHSASARHSSALVQDAAEQTAAPTQDDAAGKHDPTDGT